ncbi:MAG: SPOR domain-containing protein [Alphaproteobacteria bacterium]
MKRILLVVTIAAALAATAAHADFDAGLGAYASGDYATAIKEWRPLAEQGDAEAQFGLGEMYDLGRGVAADAEAAATWYQRAAEQGSARAQAKLGTMFAPGHGVPVDPSTAVLWWTKAAEQGSPAAQMRLGEAYRKGEGVARDLARAEAWYTKAANAGIGEARVGLFEVRKDREREAAAAADAGLASAPAAESASNLPPEPTMSGDDIVPAVPESHEVPVTAGAENAASAEAAHGEAEPAVAGDQTGATADTGADPPADIPDPLEALVAKGQAVVLRLDTAAPAAENHAEPTDGHEAEPTAADSHSATDQPTQTPEEPAIEAGDESATEAAPAPAAHAEERSQAVAGSATDQSRHEPDHGAPDMATTLAPSQPAEVAPAATRVALTTLGSSSPTAAAPQFKVWLASFESQTNALAAWAELRRRNKDVLGSAHPSIVRVELGDGQALYRVHAGPYGSAVDAQSVCNVLGERSQFCVAVAE